MIVFLVDSCPPSCPVLPVRIARFALSTCETGGGGNFIKNFFKKK